MADLLDGAVAAGAPPRTARAAAIVVHGRDQDPEWMLDVLRRVAVPDVAYLVPTARWRELP